MTSVEHKVTRYHVQDFMSITINVHSTILYTVPYSTFRKTLLQPFIIKDLCCESCCRDEKVIIVLKRRAIAIVAAFQNYLCGALVATPRVRLRTWTASTRPTRAAPSSAGATPPSSATRTQGSASWTPGAVHMMLDRVNEISRGFSQSIKTLS